ncbi:MAG: ATP-dependent zinc metalloprotease FtsH [candidate division WOR-3 bacterium]
MPEEKNKKEPQNKVQILKPFLIWAVFFSSLYIIFQYTKMERPKEVSFTMFWELVEEGKVSKVTFSGVDMIGELKDKAGLVETRLPFEDPELPKELVKRGIEVKTQIKIDFLKIGQLLFPILFMVFLFYFLMSRLRGSANEALSFGQSRAKEIRFTSVDVTFDDVAGVDEAKEELQEIVEFLKNPSKFKKLGAEIPKGVLLVGAPGTGKTLLAKAVAGEAKVPFYSISGSDFVEMFVGVGAARVRDLFRRAKMNTPCIVFIDEIDAVGRYRGAGIGGGHDEREQTLNALLVEMDGFDTNEGIIVISATNRPDILDPALLRPGRFDRRVVVPMPDMKGREAILKVHTKKIPLGSDVDLSVIAKTTPGFSGADIQNLCNEAALIAASRGKDKVESEDFDEAKDKILMGRERKSMLISEEEKKLVAYHEAGHTIASLFTKHSDPIHKVTIIPRGASLGLTQQLPLDDKRTYSKEYLEARLVVLLGGRAAEELKFKTVSTGAGNDLQNATEIARKMICEWGMSDNLGPITLERDTDSIFLGKRLAKEREYSEETARQVDLEIKNFVEKAHNIAKTIIKKHKKELDKVAEALLEKEVLTGDEVKEIVYGRGKNKEGDKRNN